MSSKKQLGQFYTTNFEYILQDFKIPPSTEKIIEPFAGQGDLIKFAEQFGSFEIESYDIDPKSDGIIQRDTLLSSPNYKNKFILTNPPYLAKNKNKQKNIYDKYKQNELYKCFIQTIIDDPAEGGIIIIPLNFISSIRKNDINLRKKFINTYHIQKINIFQEKVFQDTSYTICSILFIKRKNKNNISSICIYPSSQKIEVSLEKSNNFTIGGEIYNLPKQTEYTISRLLKDDEKNTNILVKCIDDSEKNKIQMNVVDDDKIYIDDTPKRSARSYATLKITPELSTQQQEELCKKFNQYLSEMRKKYHSLFLTNYRENNRKRISFDLVYSIVGYLLTN